MLYVSWFTSILKAAWNLGVEMAPYLWLGFAVAGLLHVFWPVETIVRHLGANSKKAVIKASILGIPLPLCSCGVLPVAAQLRKSGAGAAPTLSFLITTPVTGVDSLLATWALLGGIFTLARLSASLALGLIVGFLAALFLREPADTAQTATASKVDCTDGACAADSLPRESLPRRFLRAAHYGFWELPSTMASSVFPGLLLGGFITAILPASLVADTVGTGIAGIALAVAVAIPLYVCATGSIPIAAALMLKGFSPGAALAFLMAGPASNAVAITTVRRLLGNRHLALYLGAIFLGSLGFGAIFDLFLQFAGIHFSPEVHAAHGTHAAVPWWNTAAGILLFGVLAAALAAPWISRLKHRRHSAENEETMQDPNRIKLSVPDMSCAHCKAAISKLLSAQTGVNAVEVNLENRTVEIRHGDGFIPEEALRKLADAGYPCQILPS